MRNVAVKETCNATQSWNQQWVQLKTAGLCADHLSKFDIRLTPCKPNEWSQQWNFDIRGRLVNREANMCLEAGPDGTAYKSTYLWECHDEIHQQWTKDTQYKFVNKAFPLYLGVAFCAGISEYTVLELRELDTDEQCNASQTWF